MSFPLDNLMTNLTQNTTQKFPVILCLRKRWNWTKSTCLVTFHWVSLLKSSILQLKGSSSIHLKRLNQGTRHSLQWSVLPKMVYWLRVIQDLSASMNLKLIKRSQTLLTLISFTRKFHKSAGLVTMDRRGKNLYRWWISPLASQASPLPSSCYSNSYTVIT